MKFRTQYNNNVRPIANAGNREVTLYVLKFNDRGEEKLFPNGKKSLYDMIQSHRQSTDLAYILSRLDPEQVKNMTGGDYSAILASDVIDTTLLPTNMGEMLNLSKRGEQMFNSLPVELREEYNFSLYNFLKEYGSEKFFNRINGLYPKPVEPAPNSEGGDE